jgi:hypothetical protein
MLILYGNELLQHRPSPKLEDCPLSAVRGCMFSAVAGPFRICCVLHLQPVEVPWSAECTIRTVSRLDL